MLIVHTSDWHLGRSLHGEDLSRATQSFLDWLVELVVERQVDAVLIAGDVFDRAVPSLGALEQLSDVLIRLAEVTTAVISPGNHDSATRLGFGAGLYRDRVRIISQVSEIGQGVEVTGRDGERAVVYPIPYLEPDLVRHTLADGLSATGEADVVGGAAPGELDADANTTPPGSLPPLARSHGAVMAAALRRVRADLEARRRRGDDAPAIAMVHAFITGGHPSDSERDIQVGGVPSVPLGLFDTLGGSDSAREGLSYIAAGHLHRPQSLTGASMPIRYSGSPVAYSFSEAGIPKTVTLVSLIDGRVAGVDAVDVPIVQDMAVISGTMEHLLSSYKDLTQHYLHLTVTDSSRPTEMVARLRSRFPFALVLLHSPADGPAPSSSPAALNALTPRELGTQFFVENGGRPLHPEEVDAVDVAYSLASRQVGR